MAICHLFIDMEVRMSLGFEKTARSPFHSLFNLCFLVCVFTACFQQFSCAQVAAAAMQAGTGASYGLEWPGDGAVRRMLYWHNPFPIYDATYIFKVYPRKKTVSSIDTTKTGILPTFFWGNDGSSLTRPIRSRME